MKGKIIVLDVRLDQLRRAIDSQSWDDTRWQYDRVHRAFEKVRDAAGVVPDAPAADTSKPPSTATPKET